MSTAAITSPAAGSGPQRGGRGRAKRWSLGTPFSYLGGLVVVLISIVPLLFVALGGFRTTAQINAQPAAWPHPWVFSNYSSIITSTMFWQELGNSAFIAVVATVLAVGL